MQTLAALASLCAVSLAAHPAWTPVTESPRDHSLKLTVAVRQSPEKLAALEAAFWDVSDPTSESYTQYLSMAELDAMSAPAPESITAVETWLRAVVGPTAAITFSPARDYVFCTVSVSQAEKLLPGSRYQAHQLVGDESATHTVHRTSSPFTLPAHVAPHVQFVSPTTRFPAPGRLLKQRQQQLAKLQSGSNSPSTNLKTSPQSLRDLYGIGDRTGEWREDNKQQVAGFLKNFMSQSDLQLFYGSYYSPGKSFPKPVIVGPNNEGNPTAEGSLDIQFLMSIGANISTEYWYTAGEIPYEDGENEDFVEWLTNLMALNETKLPNVISVSYADEEFVVDPDFAKRIDTEFQKLALRGTTLLFGSGDDGVTGDHGKCPGDRFVAWYPATSLFVTGVGATNEMNALQGASFSGGGFSWYYDAPDFQKSHIANYVNNNNMPNASWWSQSGRGWPDVAAVGLGFWTYVGGIPDEVGGTSAATPVFAGIVSLLNDARIKEGKKPLGFLNQLLYAHPEVFTDITRGTNTGLGGCGIGGFSAAEGWDPVTGLGTPKFPEMLKLVLSLP